MLTRLYSVAALQLEPRLFFCRCSIDVCSVLCNKGGTCAGRGVLVQCNATVNFKQGDIPPHSRVSIDIQSRRPWHAVRCSQYTVTAAPSCCAIVTTTNQDHRHPGAWPTRPEHRPAWFLSVDDARQHRIGNGLTLTAPPVVVLSRQPRSACIVPVVCRCVVRCILRNVRRHRFAGSRPTFLPFHPMSAARYDLPTAILHRARTRRTRTDSNVPHGAGQVQWPCLELVEAGRVAYRGP